ncbi:hypothetical protein JCM11251_006239 [Rhodosporidiobolus azoricus]
MAAASGLFAGPAGTRRHDDGRQAVFVQFKALCVPLLEAARSPSYSATARTAVPLLGQLRETVINTVAPSFSPALANYVFFPLSSLLQPRQDGTDRGDRVLESTMLVLAALVPKWRAAGMDQRVRQELWIMTALTLGGPLDASRPPGHSAEKGKRKAVERTDETKKAMVEVLLALMQPDQAFEHQQKEGGEEDPLGERINWSAADPSSAPIPPRLPHFRPPPVPILFHTLTTLLTLAAEPTSLLQLQFSSLSALRILLFDYLTNPAPSPTVATVEAGFGPSPLLATALPGTASTLSRIALSKPRTTVEAETSTRRQASGIVVEAVRVLSQLLVATVSDSTVAHLWSQRSEDAAAVLSATLEELVELRLADGPPAEEAEGTDEAVPSPPDPPPTPPSGPTLPTAAWLRYTVTSISTLLSALSPLSTHESPLVRASLVSLLGDIVQSCPTALGEHLDIPLEGLLALASDKWDEVSSPARRALLVAFSVPSSETPKHPLTLAAEIVQRRLAALPRSIRRQDEHAVRRGAGIVRSALEVLPTFQATAASGAGKGFLLGAEKWSWQLLVALEFERIPAAGRAAEGGMSLAWITSSGETSSAGSGETTAFPPVRLRTLDEEATLASLDALWESLGRSADAAGQGGEVVDLFLGVALGPRRGETVASSALWALDGVLSGFKGEKVDKAQKKVLRLAIKAVLSLLQELEIAEDEESSAPVPSSKTDLLAVEEGDSPAIGVIERKKGVTETPSLDKYNPAVALSTSREARASQQLLLISLSLRLLSTLATLLTSSFQPFLMQSLYHVLAHISPTSHPYLRAHAQHALFLISDATSFASPQNLVLSNVDYVVNSVSQRLSVSRLEPNAPLVLVEMIRLVGKPVVPMVQDLVDDVFEALDDYHGYEEVTVGLWAVLDALLKVMEEDLPERRSERKMDVIKVDSETDWRTFQDWLAHRNDRPEGEEDDVEEINPQRPFDSGFNGGAKEDPEAEDEPTSFPEDEKKVVPPTRPQVVTAQILSKAAYFLSHPSPFLRARVLSLIASAVPLLSRPSLDAPDPKATRASDLLPIIHRAWPFILNRLGDAEAYVVVEAAMLIESLAVHVGDFMSRRILDDVWPRFRTLLAKQEKQDQQSALFPSSSSVGSTPSSTRYTTSHRLHRSILVTLVHVAQDVPLKEAILWEQAVLLRRFLAVQSVEPELQIAAFELYSALGEINPDAVWLVLAATVGAEEGLPRYLRREGVDFGTNIQRLLQRL